MKNLLSILVVLIVATGCNESSGNYLYDTADQFEELSFDGVVSKKWIDTINPGVSYTYGVNIKDNGNTKRIPFELWLDDKAIFNYISEGDTISKEENSYSISILKNNIDSGITIYIGG